MPVVTPPCPLCHGSRATTIARDVRDWEYGTPGDYQWLACDGCGLVRLDPFPDSALLAAAYPPTYHAYVAPSSRLSRWAIDRAREGTARAIAARLPSGGTVLDVGCSTGALLAAVGRLGTYRLFGVEYKADAAAEARARGIDVWNGELDDAPFVPATFDVVTLQHVLEHVTDPMRTLARVAALLRPGGRVMGELPNLDSWDARLFGRTWGGGHAPRHLWHFTPATLMRALEASGFGQVVIRPALHTGHWALSIQNWLRRARTDTNGLRSGRSWYFPLLLLATLPVNAMQMPLLHTGVMRFEAVRDDRRD